MILGQISYIDCIAFLIFLAPQLLLQVGIFRTAFWVVGALPYLAIKIPLQFLHERYITPRTNQSPFVQNATPFQDFVIRCVRFAFAKMPASIGRVFFSKNVALPFLYFRMLRHGYWRCPLSWRQVNRKDFKGLWIVSDENKRPDVVIYYCHGGGFSMGSSYFYMEFLLAWTTLLQANSNFTNPAIFALEYTLSPDAVHPKQTQEAFAAYQHVLSTVGEASRICISGDSAGATLMLSLLLYLAGHAQYQSRLPGLAALISPWVTIVSEKNRNTPSDFLDAKSLEVYGRQYIGGEVPYDDPLVSPGHCKDLRKWLKASPTRGWLFMYGSEEVLAPETRDLVSLLEKAGAVVEVHEEQGAIHAWPVVSLYLGVTRSARLHGLQDIVQFISRKMT